MRGLMGYYVESTKRRRHFLNKNKYLEFIKS